MAKHAFLKSLISALVLLTGIATAQLPDYQLHRVQEEGGLKTADVVDMAKDKEGFLWIAVQSQVQQFDGRQTIHFPFTETITRLLIDRFDRKWILTRANIFMMDDRERFKIVGIEGSSQAIPTALFETVDGSIIILIQRKAYRFDDPTNTFVPVPNFFPSQLNPSRFHGRQGENYFFGSNDSVICYQSSSKTIKTASISNIVSVVPLSTTEALVSTYQYKTFYVNFHQQVVKKIVASDSNFVIYHGVRHGNNSYLLSTNLGFYHLQLSSLTLHTPVLYHDGQPLENPASTTLLYSDQGGNLFMNNANGIYLLSQKNGFIRYFRNYQWGSNKMPANDVRDFAEDDEGKIWMATTNGIVRLDVQSGALTNFDPIDRRLSLDYPSYRQLLHIGSKLFIGTSGNGVWIYDKLNGKKQRPRFLADANEQQQLNDFENSYIWKLLRLASGDILVVGGSKLYIINNVSYTARQLPMSFRPAISRSALQDSAGRIWHGTDKGLFCYNENFLLLFKIYDSLPDRRVASLCEWTKNKMLIGSKGLFELISGTSGPKAFRKINAIPTERLIYCMQQDDEGFVWMGTDDGIYRYDPQTEKAVLFDASDHVQTQAFNSDGAFLSSKGLVFMGGKNGINYFDPKSYTAITENLQPRLLTFTAQLADSLESYPKNVPYANREINFSISAPDFVKPFRIQYRYRLRETDDWNSTGYNNTVRIDQLESGNYKLQVAASFDGMTWFTNSDPPVFTVLKPWWNTTWFRIIALLVAAGAFWVVKNYLRRKREAAVIKRMVDYFRQNASYPSSVDYILWDIAGNCISRLDFQDCVIYLLDEKRGMLLQKAAYGTKSTSAFEITNPIEIPVGKGITGYVAESKKPLIVKDTSIDSRYIVDDQKRLSEVAVPILHEGRLIGVIDAEHPKKNFFTSHHLKTLQTVASLCASRIATAMASEATIKAEAELQLLNGKMLESKFTNLRLQMNPHFLFNILTTIQYLIVSGQVSKATHYVDVFSGFLRSLLDHAEDSVVTLHEELRILNLYVELESLILDETFEAKIEVAEEIDQEEVQVPFMLLQPFVENAIHHGLVHKIGEKRFRIVIREEDENSLYCTVDDNGVGRIAAGRRNEENLSRVLHHSKGIRIVEQRLELLQQKTDKKASVRFEDLYNDDIPSGTTVHLIIPYYLTEEV
ncbi:MAG: histidine kinase [Chitinophagaceae bacterium]|nr:histidine kinase [Chitinophagaceae bacterium]